MSMNPDSPQNQLLSSAFGIGRRAANREILDRLDGIEKTLRVIAGNPYGTGLPDFNSMSFGRRDANRARREASRGGRGQVGVGFKSADGSAYGENLVKDDFAKSLRSRTTRMVDSRSGEDIVYGRPDLGRLSKRNRKESPDEGRNRWLDLQDEETQDRYRRLYEEDPDGARKTIDEERKKDKDSYEDYLHEKGWPRGFNTEEGYKEYLNDKEEKEGAGKISEEMQKMMELLESNHAALDTKLEKIWQELFTNPI